MTQDEADRLVHAGVASLQRSDPAEARRAFEQVASAGGAIPPPWLLIAQACRLQGDDAAERVALDRLLDAQPRHPRGLIMKGDMLARTGDARGAHSFWRLAINIAGRLADLPPALSADLARVSAALEQGKGEYRAHLDHALDAGGFGPTALSHRLRDALAIMNGEKQLYLQQPTSFYFPGLPQIQFYERAAFDWVETVEIATPAIRAELDAVLAETHDFPPYVENDLNRPNKAHGLVANRDWGAFHLLQSDPVSPNAERCPATMAALSAAPQPVIRGRSPMALFSLLKAGAHIFPHNGLLNTRLICHLPVIVPGNCTLRVGNETREWREGELLIFDDSIEHEAWNRSGSRRVVLLFEIWRPEIAAEDRAALTVLFEAIDAFRGQALDVSS